MSQAAIPVVEAVRQLAAASDFDVADANGYTPFAAAVAAASVGAFKIDFFC